MTVVTTRPSLTQALTQVTTGRGDIRTILRGKTWAQFKHLQQGFENSRGIRLFYYDGTVEILMPGVAHELFKSIIGFLIELYLFNCKIEFKPTGSATQEMPGMGAAEADESYEIQGYKLAIEVNFTSGDISKLSLYQALAVDEVWLWEDGVLDIYHLRSGEYEPVSHSLIPALSEIEMKVMSECILLGETSRIAAAERLLATAPAPSSS
jgi:Uma2 family endonuclease